MNTDATSLDRLHDIVVPAAMSWWPPAPAWYWLMAFAAIAILWAAIAWFVRWQRDAYRREALAEWKRINLLLAEPERRVAALSELAALLKRTAITVFPRAEVAALTGEAWRTFLNRSASMSGFTTPAGERLECSAYGGADVLELTDQNAKESAQLVHEWLTCHRVDPSSSSEQRKAAR